MRAGIPKTASATTIAVTSPAKAALGALAQPVPSNTMSTKTGSAAASVETIHDENGS
jgi:hypothetical protein